MAKRKSRSKKKETKKEEIVLTPKGEKVKNGIYWTCPSCGKLSHIDKNAKKCPAIKTIIYKAEGDVLRAVREVCGYKIK